MTLCDAKNPLEAHRPEFPVRLLLFWIRRCLLGWLLIATVIFSFQVAVCAMVHDNENVQALLSLLKVLPSFIQNMLGGARLMGGDVVALISIGYLHPLVLILFMVYAVATPTGLLVGEIQQGSMEMILGRAVSKSQVYWCAVLPTIGGMFLLTQCMFLGTVAGTSLFDFGERIPLDGFYRLCINAGMLAITVSTIALFVSSWCGDRTFAVTITVTYLVFDYFLSIVSMWWPPMESFRKLSLFNYVNGPGIFRDQAWPVVEMLVLTAVSVTMIGAGWIIWTRRDLPA